MIRHVTMDNTSECYVCYENLTDKNKTTLDCGHSLHSNCFAKWILTELRTKDHVRCGYCNGHAYEDTDGLYPSPPSPPLSPIGSRRGGIFGLGEYSSTFGPFSVPALLSLQRSMNAPVPPRPIQSVWGGTSYILPTNAMYDDDGDDLNSTFRPQSQAPPPPPLSRPTRPRRSFRPHPRPPEGQQEEQGRSEHDPL